jgi:23S rRNA pseudouridine1911/1915/1917 synthase
VATVSTGAQAQVTEFEVPAEAAGLRLDQCLARCVPGLSRRTARIALDLGGVFIDNKRVKVAGRTVYPGQQVRVHLGTAFATATKATGRDARARDEAKLPPPQILFEDEHVIAVLKPAGLLSAPTPESDRNNLVSVLSHRTTPPERLFVVHRLDLHTSGVLIVARTEAANQRLSELFRVHDLTRLYETWVSGHVAESEFTVNTPVGGKPATTHFRVLARLTSQGGPVTHLEAKLETGRTHQIRIHAASIGHPVLADLKYGMREAWHPARLALHAKHLALAHPVTNQPLELSALTPPDLDAWLASVVNPDVTP